MDHFLPNYELGSSPLSKAIIKIRAVELEMGVVKGAVAGIVGRGRGSWENGVGGVGDVGVSDGVGGVRVGIGETGVVEMGRDWEVMSEERRVEMLQDGDIMGNIALAEVSQDAEMITKTAFAGTSKNGERKGEDETVKPSKQRKMSRTQKKAFRLANPMPAKPKKTKKPKKEPHPPATTEQKRNARRAKKQRQAQRKRKAQEAAEPAQPSNIEQHGLPKFSTASNKLPLTFNRMKNEIRPDSDPNAMAEATAAYTASQPPLYEQSWVVDYPPPNTMLPSMPVRPTFIPAGYSQHLGNYSQLFDHDQIMPSNAPRPFYHECAMPNMPGITAPSFDFTTTYQPYYQEHARPIMPNITAPSFNFSSTPQFQTRRPSFVYGGVQWEPESIEQSRAMLDYHDIHSIADSDHPASMKEESIRVRLAFLLPVLMSASNKLGWVFRGRRNFGRCL